MTISRFRRLRTHRSVGDPLPQKRAGSLAMRFFGSCALFVAALASLMAGGSLAVSGASPAGASPAGITVNCGAGDNLQDAIYSAAAGSTLLVSGTCTGNPITGTFYIDKDLTLSGPAILDGSGNPLAGTTLNVGGGTVVLNDLVIQNGIGIDGLGGGLWNSGQLTLNHSTVKNNTASAVGGVFNTGQLTLNNSTVSYNTAANGEGGIFNCGGNPGFEHYGLCTGNPTLTLNHSNVANNVGGFGEAGGIDNDIQGVMTLNGSTVFGNTASGNGGGIENNGRATLKNSNVSGNTTATGTYSNGGGIENNGTATLISSTVSGNSTGTNGSGGGIENNGTATLISSTLSGNTSGSNGGGIQNEGTATLNSSTVSGNTGGSGGGIQNNGTATLNQSTVSNNASTAPGQFFGNGGGVSSGPSNTDLTTLNNCIIRANTAVFVGGGIFEGGGPMKINNSVVTGNSALTTGGGMVVWNGPATVNNSAFSNNSDPGQIVPDSLPGVSVAPADFLGPGSNNPTFTTHHSTYS